MSRCSVRSTASGGPHGSRPRQAARRRLPRALLVALGLSGAVANAHAQQLFPERYVACRELDTRRIVRPSPVPTAPPTPSVEPLPRRATAPKLPVAPLVVIDVPIAEAIPTRSPEATSRPAPPKTRFADVGPNDYKCLGFPRGRRGIARVVSAPPGTRWYDRGASEGYRLDNMVAASAFGAHELVPELERHLRRGLPSGLEGYYEHEALRVKLQAALALADLGHRPAAPLVLGLVHDLAGRSWSLLWRDALDPLARIDSELAQSYALDALAELGAADRTTAASANRLRALLPLVTRPSPRAVSVLTALSQPLADQHSDTKRHDECLLLAARIRAGDRDLRDEIRAELGVDLATSRSVTCYSQLVEAAFPGEEPDEVSVLTHRWRYEAIVRLLGRLAERERAGQRDPAFDRARSELRRWLDRQSLEPEIAAGPTDRRFNSKMRARHLVALTMLGDRAARAQLERLVTDPEDRGHASWIAVHHMLEHELPGAAELAEGLLRRAVRERTERFDNTDRPHRGPLLVTEHVMVIDALGERRDPRFSLGLLDRDAWAREAALRWLARLAPVDACELVAGAADGAERKAVEDAFWALSVLGTACAPAMRRIASESAHPAVVRGMALELLAMMRDRSLPGRLEGIDRTHELFPWAGRAAIIYRTAGGVGAEMVVPSLR